MSAQPTKTPSDEVALYTGAICGVDFALLIPLHGDNGGSLCCPVCVGKWNAEYGRRRRLGRIAIRAMKAYLDADGSRATDLDKLKLSALGMGFYDLDELGYLAGIAKPGEETIDLTAELLADAISLVHPDKHPPERRCVAHRVSQELIALKPFVFAKPAQKPSRSRAPDGAPRVPAPRVPAVHAHRYPCATCRSTIPHFYCDSCKTEWRKRDYERIARERAQRRTAHRGVVTDNQKFIAEQTPSRDAAKGSAL